MLLLLLACGASERPQPPPQVEVADFANVAPAKVTELQPCGSRTAARVQEAAWDFWVSIPKTELKVGDFLLLGKGDKAPTLDCEGRALADVLVIDAAQVVDQAAASSAARLEAPEGGLPIAEVVARRVELSGQVVKVRGRVVKVNRGIFGKNWLHLNDGSLSEGDLTVTTDTDAGVGDIVRAEAPVTVDKDFGFGYFYPVILEGATAVVE